MPIVDEGIGNRHVADLPGVPVRPAKEPVLQNEPRPHARAEDDGHDRRETAVALGEPVSLTVQARGLNLDALDLASLDATFEVFARTRSGGPDSETLVLTLYPRAVGALQIPPLHVERMRTPALPLKVSDGSATVPRVTASWTLKCFRSCAI